MIAHQFTCRKPEKQSVVYFNKGLERRGGGDMGENENVLEKGYLQPCEQRDKGRKSQHWGDCVVAPFGILHCMYTSIYMV